MQGAADAAAGGKGCNGGGGCHGDGAAGVVICSVPYFILLSNLYSILYFIL